MEAVHDATIGHASATAEKMTEKDVKSTAAREEAKATPRRR